MRDRDLVRLYWPAELKPAFDALFAVDDALAEVVTSSTQPALGAIRLAWWREALERLDSKPPPPEPRLQAAARELLPRGISGRELARLEVGWSALLEPFPDDDLTMEQVAERGTVFFQMASTLIANANKQIDQAGALWGLTNAARQSVDWPTRTHLFLHAEEALARLCSHRFDRRVRPLTALAGLAARDAKKGEFNIEPEATPGRALVLLRHRITGRIA